MYIASVATGRAGNTGVAMTFITRVEFRQLKLIERIAKLKSNVVSRRLSRTLLNASVTRLSAKCKLY